MKGIGVLFKRNKYKRLCALGEIDSEFSMSHVRRVATPDPWNQIQGSIGRKTSKDQENGLFQLLLNAVLDDINNYAIDELHTAHAIILYKAHGKDKSSERSYRTISSCPFISKCADKYVGSLENEAWEASEAETQFQG